MHCNSIRSTPRAATWKRGNGRQLVIRASTSVDSPTSQVKRVELGKSGLQVSEIGIGAWSWGDRSGYWGYGHEYGKSESLEAYKALIDVGIDFIDTAEVYGFGKSEEFLGEFMKQTKTSPVIATKFPPLPWRLTQDSVPIALKASLERLQLPKVGLYMIHWPGFFFNAFSNDAYIEGLGLCVEQGLTDAVGVSNFKEERLRQAHKQLAQKGVPLASNQVQYSLLYRKPEKNGVMETCKELGITLIAYSPIAQGLLTGKYKPGNVPSGPRGAYINEKRVKEVQPLISALTEMGKEHGDKTPAQVAINWTLCKGVLPIPGAKNLKQVDELVGAVGWRLSDAEVAELDKLSDQYTSSTGAPFENW